MGCGMRGATKRYAPYCSHKCRAACADYELARLKEAEQPCAPRAKRKARLNENCIGADVLGGRKL